MADVVDRVRCELRNVAENPAHPYDKNIDKHLQRFIDPAIAEIEKEIDEDKRQPYDLNDYEVGRVARRLYNAHPDYAKFKVGNFIEGTAVAFVLTLQIKDSGGIGNNAASATWSGIPINMGLFSIKVLGGFNGSARRAATYKVSLRMRDLHAWPDAKLRCDELHTDRPAGLRLAGNFGVDEWIERAIDTAFLTGTNRYFTSTGTTLEFTVTPTLGVTPTWSIVRPVARKFDGTFTLGGQRDYDNTLDLALTQISGDPGPSEVIVTNFPEDFVGRVPPQFTRKITPVRPRTGPSGGELDPSTQYKLDNTLQRLLDNSTGRREPLQ